MRGAGENTLGRGPTGWTTALAAAALFLAAVRAVAAPAAIATFQSIGLYWAPAGGAPDNPARVQFRPAASGAAWRQGLDLWFDERNREYRGSLVELEPGTRYEIRLTLASGRSEKLSAATWSESFRVKRTVYLRPGTTHLVIGENDSGSAREGYVVFTGRRGENVIDQSGVAGDEPSDSCVRVKQGVHHVIIRGLVLRNCKRHAVYLERQFEPVLDTTTHDIVIEDNAISGWGGRDRVTPGAIDDDGAIQCQYWRETEARKRPSRIIVQRNRFFDPRHGANPWRAGAAPRSHPHGPQAVTFMRCGSNHVLRYNEIGSKNGNHYNDGFGGGDNFSAEGFPWADSDIYANRFSEIYDDAIEAEGGNRNVRIWGNYFDRVFVAIANAATSVGPLYVWRNVSNRMAGMYQPDAPPDLEERGSFIKAGSPSPSANGGRAYYFHNTVLQPPAGAAGRLPLGAGGGIAKSGGTLYNFVSRNNIWQIHKEALIDGQAKFYSIRADCDAGFCDADFDLFNGALANAGRAQRHGVRGRPVYAAGQPSAGDFSLSPQSPGYRRAQRLPNFNDAFEQPDVGAHQSGTPPMRFGLDAPRLTPRASERPAARPPAPARARAPHTRPSS